MIQGNAGERVLEGEVAVGGAKNAVIKAIAATLLFEGDVSLENVPAIEDVRRMFELLAALGAKVDYNEAEHRATVNTDTVRSAEIDPEIAKRLRASVVAIGPLLARFGRVTFPMPGGCVLGARPIDQFERGFRQMWASVEYDEANERFEIVAGKGRLKGADIFFTKQTHTGTETMMMAATLAEGTTVLRNCAMEPEVGHLADFLNSCGAQISGAGTPTITIEGRRGALLKALSAYITLPDRIEAGSLLILGALLAKELRIVECVPEHLRAVIDTLRDCGMAIETAPDSITVRASDELKAVDIIKTHEYPGFPTDLQAPMTVFLTQAKGESVIFETIFDGRLNYIDDLLRMGANIVQWDAHRIQIIGPTLLKGRELAGPDIRTGFAFIIAALAAREESTIDNIYYVDRGYEKIEEKLKAVGADIRREES